MAQHYTKSAFITKVLAEELEMAVLSGQLSTVRQLVKENKTIINHLIYKAGGYDTLLGYTCFWYNNGLQKQFEEIVSYLLSQHADPNQYAEKGTLPLYYAIKHQNPNLVRMLLANAADASLEITDLFTRKKMNCYQLLRQELQQNYNKRNEAVFALSSFEKKRIDKQVVALEQIAILMPQNSFSVKHLPVPDLETH